MVKKMTEAAKRLAEIDGWGIYFTAPDGVLLIWYDKELKEYFLDHKACFSHMKSHKSLIWRPLPSLPREV